MLDLQRKKVLIEAWYNIIYIRDIFIYISKKKKTKQIYINLYYI